MPGRIFCIPIRLQVGAGSMPGVGLLVGAVTWLCAMAAIVTGTGCGPKPVSAGTAGWPAEYLGRRLWAGTNAVIYASTAANAADVDGWLKGASRRLRSQTGTAASFGVIMVTDTRDAPLFTDDRLLERAIRHTSDVAHGRTSEASPDGPSKASHMITTQESNDARLPAQRFLRMQAVMLPLDDLCRGLGLPPSTSRELRWAVSVHSLDSMNAALDEQMRDAPVTMRAISGMMRTTSRTSFARKNELVIYMAMVEAQQQWPPDRRRSLITEAMVSLLGKEQAEAYQRDGPGVTRW